MILLVIESVTNTFLVLVGEITKAVFSCIRDLFDVKIVETFYRNK